MIKKINIIFLIGIIFPNIQNKIDINFCSFDELKTLPLSDTKIIAISEYLEYKEVSSIYELLEADAINIKDIHDIRSLVKINLNNVDNNINAKNYNIENEEVSISSIPTDYLLWNKKYDINEVTYDQLNAIKNVSSIDAEAVIKQRKRGPIDGTFQLKNSPGISYYGYKNILSNISFKEDSNKTSFYFESIVNSLPSRINDDEDEEPSYFGKNNPSTFYRFQLSKNNYSIGHVRYNNTGDPTGIYTNKEYIDFNNLVISKKNNAFKIDHLILGNFIANYGQGLVMASGDSHRSRFTGHKYSKRNDGILPDNLESELLTLRGVAFQMSNNNIRLSIFYSDDNRDAIINEDGSFTSLIFMRPRLSFGANNNNNRIYSDMIDAVNEKTYGLNFRISPFKEFPATSFGYTNYVSVYDKKLDPQIINTIVGGGSDINPGFDEINCDDENLAFDTNLDGCVCCDGDYYINDYDEYSGDAFFANYWQSNSTDGELLAMYRDNSSSGEHSERRVSGINFSTVIKNTVLQVEYAKMYEQINLEDLLDFSNKNEPKALLINAFMQFDNLDITIIHRDYDVAFDNPYQKSFSEYGRYKSSILEDVWWLEDPIFTNLYSSNPQPQPEKGTYIESRYQFHEKFILGLQWDSWIRKADNAKYFRILTKLEWRPLFNYRVYFRYKLQARGSFSFHHPSPYFTKEARIRFKLRLSNYNNVELLYSWNNTTFSPRPRLVESSNPYVTSMTVGDFGSPDESIGFSFEHNFYGKSDLNLKLKAGVLYAHGFLWYFDVNDFQIFNTETGLVNTWISFGINPMENLACSFKVSMQSDVPSTTTIGGYSNSGAFINDVYIHEQKFDYRFQIDYKI